MKKISFKVKFIVFVLVTIAVVLSILIGKSVIRNNRITNELTEIAKSYGLKNIKISIGGKIPDYSFYSVTVDSSNFDSLSFSQMYALDSAMSSVDDAFVSKYTSNGNYYEVFPSSKSIYKNGSEIHNDYWNSETHKDAIKNDESKPSYSSSSKSSSRSYIPYKSSDEDDDDDPYNAKDYSDEEDFYEDHYDDFFDYYDAEDYYREHTN